MHVKALAVVKVGLRLIMFVDNNVHELLKRATRCPLSLVHITLLSCGYLSMNQLQLPRVSTSQCSETAYQHIRGGFCTWIKYEHTKDQLQVC
jgi:hypothetical protein